MSKSNDMKMIIGNCKVGELDIGVKYGSKLYKEFGMREGNGF